VQLRRNFCLFSSPSPSPSPSCSSRTSSSASLSWLFDDQSPCHWAISVDDKNRWHWSVSSQASYIALFALSRGIWFSDSRGLIAPRESQHVSEASWNMSHVVSRADPLMMQTQSRHTAVIASSFSYWLWGD
jgi:hypothetical protein